MKSMKSKLLALMLVFAMLIELAPTSALAVPGEGIDPTDEQEEILSEPDVSEGTGEEEPAAVKEAAVLGEIAELREENVKHFRLDDGTNLAVSFGSQIHYKDENDAWTDIDNSLSLKENTSVPGMDSDGSTEAKTNVYEAVNGDQVRQFAATIEENGFLFSAKSGNNSFSLFIENQEQDKAFDGDNNVQDADSTAEDQQNVDEEIFEEEPPVEQVETADNVSDDENDGKAALAEGLMDPEVEPAEDQQNDDGENDLIDTPTAEPISECLEQPNNAPQQYSVTAKLSYPSARYAKMSEEEKQALPISEQIEPEKLAADISYSNVWPDTDILYQPYGMNVKESIILTQPKEQYEYSFRLHLDGFFATLNEDGSISLMDADGESIFEIPAPFMEDSDGALSSDVSYSLKETQEDYFLSIWADPDWINDPSRVWPITIDPTVMYRSNSSNPNILTSYVNSDRPTTASYNNTGYLRSGYYTNTSYDANCTGHTVGLIYVNNLPEVPNGCVVTAAHLEFSQVLYGGTDNVGYHRLYATNISAPSNPATYLSGMTWNSYISNIFPYYIKPNGEEPAALDYSKEYYYPGKRTIYAITSAAKSWYDPNDSSVSRLLVLDNGHTSTTNARVTYAGYNYGASAYEPKIYVQYLNTVGIDGNSGYHTQDIGRAGTGYVNDFTLKTSLCVPLVAAPSDALPFTLSAIYNEDRSNAQFTSNTSNGVHTVNYSTANMGFGWKLSVHQSICSVNLQNGSSTKTHLVYTDSDGTEHYFTKESGSSEYKDEEGLGLKITGSSSSYTMKDKSGNTWIFTYGYLTEYTSSEGNKLYYAYDDVDYSSSSSAWKPTNSNDAHRVTSVWRRNNGANSYRIAKIQYSGSHLSYVEDASGRRTNFGYNDSYATKLTSIGFKDNNWVSYGYSLYNGYYRISNAIDHEKEYRIDYSYQGDHPMRVLRYTESVQNSSGGWDVGQKVNCYQHNANYSRFRYFDAGDTSTNGKMVTLHYFDNVGRTINTITMNATETEVIGVSTDTYTKNSGTNPKNNRLINTASAGVKTANLLIDSGFESATPGSNWSPYSYSGNGSTEFVSSFGGQSPHTGNKMMKMTLDDNGIRSAFQNVYLKGGTTYVFSGYVNSICASCFDTCEAGLEIQSSTGGSIGASSRKIKYYTNNSIDNGWSRLEVSYRPNASGYYRVAAVIENYIGDVLFDDFQLEAYPVTGTNEGGASTVNLVQYGSFEQIGSSGNITDGVGNWWTYNTSEAVPSDAMAHTGSHSMTFAPSMSAEQRAKQVIKINRPANRTYTLSAWGWTPQTNLHDGKEMEGDNSNDARFFGIIAKLEYENSSYSPDYFYLSFNGDIPDWQFSSVLIVPKQAKEHPDATVSKITLEAALDYCANRAYIDDVSLTAEPVQTYEYDNEGNLVSATDSEGKTSVDRDSYDRVTKYTALNGVVYNLTYPTNNTTTQNATEITCDGVKTTKTYTAGLETYNKVQKTGSNLYLESSASLNDTRDFYNGTTDANGIHTSQYHVPTNGLLTLSTTPNGSTNYTYDPDNDRPDSVYRSGIACLNYLYADNGLLSQLKRKTFRNGNEIYQAYNYTYNKWGQKTKVTVNNGSSGSGIILASYEYDEKGRQTALAYGYDLSNSGSTGAHIGYEYDLLDRPVHKVYYTGSNAVAADYHYVYDAEGNLAKQYAMGSNGRHSEEYHFEYDSLGRLIRSQEVGPDDNIKQHTERVYDTANRLSSQAWTVEDDDFKEEYTYNTNDGSLSLFKTAAGNKLSYTYDVLKRPNRINILTENGTTTRFYTVQNYQSSGYKSTDLISGFAYRKSDGNIINYNTYEYDAVGNIKTINKVVQSGAQTQTQTLAQYEYDNQNQLIKETRGNTVCQYTYDTAGNILSASASGQDTITYTYDNDDWQDLLTEIRKGNTAKKIAYEGQTHNANYTIVNGTPRSGNPINWYNGSLYTNLTWTQGQRLTSLNKGGATFSFTYDMDGIRSGKTANGATHNYITQNGKVVRETISSNATNYTLDFIYDAGGSPFAMIYTNSGGVKTTFYYVLNAQGDVVSLINQYGTLQASYTYDAWGAMLSSQSYNSNYPYLHDVNPLRYRGYYYDGETGWYYLQSRYYDPVVKRFLNADSFSTTNQGFIGYNMFAYCNNNPVDANDSEGQARRRAGLSRKAARKRSCANSLKGGSGKTTRKASSGVRKILEAICSKKESGNTFSVSGSYCTGSGPSGRGQTFSLVADTSYNYAIQVSDMDIESSGPGGASAALLFTYTNGRDFTELEGDSKSIGITVVEIAGLTIDYISFSPAPCEHRWGLSIGLCFGAQEDIHSTESQTTTRGVWNPIKSIINRVYE